MTNYFIFLESNSCISIQSNKVFQIIWHNVYTFKKTNYIIINA